MNENELADEREKAVARAAERRRKFLEEFEQWERDMLAYPFASCKSRDEVPLPPGYTIVDLETTGTDRREDRVVQISVRRCDSNGVCQESFTSLVNPGSREPHPDAVEVHGLTMDMLQVAPPFTKLMPRVRELLADNVFVAFNAGFDLPMLQREFERAGKMYEPAQQACLLWIYRENEPDRESHKLTDWAEDRGIEFQAHNADEDTRISELFLRETIERGVAPESLYFNEDLWVRRKVESDPDNGEPASDKSIRYLFVIARKMGWLDDFGDVQAARVQRLCREVNGCEMSEMTKLQQARMVDAFKFLALREQARAAQTSQ